METKLTIKVPIKGNESFIINLDATGSPLPSASVASDNNIYLSGGVYNRRVVNNSVTPPLYSWSQVTDYEFPTLNSGVEIIDFKYEATRMGNAPTITATFYSYVNYDKIWSSECYVVFKNEKYYLKQKPTFTKENTDARYKYEATFISERKILENIYIYDLDSPYFSLKPITQSSVFSFFGDITEFRIRVNASLVKAGLAEIAIRTDVIVNNNPNPLYPYYMLVTYSEWVDWGNGVTPSGKTTSDLTRGISNFYTYYGGDYIAYLWGELYFTYDEWLQLGTGTYTGWKITDDPYNEQIAQSSHYHANIYDHYEGDYEAYMKGEVYAYQGSDPILTGYQVVIGKDKYGETQTSDEMLVQFDNTTIYDALQQIKETYKLQYYIYKSGDNTYIVIGDNEYEFAQHDGSGNIIRDNTTHLPATPEPFAYGSTNELLSFSKSPNDKKIITRCSGLGSEENIPWYYPNPMADGWLKPIYRRGSSQLNKTIDYPTTEGDTLFEQNRYERWLKNHLLDKFTFGWKYVAVNELGYEDDAQLSFLNATQAQIVFRFRLTQSSLLKTYYKHSYEYGDIVGMTITKDGVTFADTDHAFVPTPNPTTPVSYPSTHFFTSTLRQPFPAGDYEYTFQIKFSQQPTVIDSGTTLYYYYPAKHYYWNFAETVKWKFILEIIKSVALGDWGSLWQKMALYKTVWDDIYPPFISTNPDLEFHATKNLQQCGWYDRNTGNKISPHTDTMIFGEKDKTYYAFMGGNGGQSIANGDVVYKITYKDQKIKCYHIDFAPSGYSFNEYLMDLIPYKLFGSSFTTKQNVFSVEEATVDIQTYIEQYFDLEINGYKTGWYRNRSGKQVELYDYGIDNENALTYGTIPADDVQLDDIITFQRYKWLTPIGNLMPEVFRRSDETERFYNAINYPLSSAVARYIYGEYLNNGLVYNDIYLSPQSVIYQFENLYAQPLICEHIEKFDDIKPTIENVRNYVLLLKRPPDWTTNWANYYEYDAINHVFLSLSSYGSAPTFPLNNTIYYASVLINIAEEYGYDLTDDDSVWVDEEDGNTVGEYKHPHFFVKLRPLGFNLFDLALEGGGDMVLSMKTGACGACNFKIKVDEDTGKNPVQIWEYDVYRKSGDDTYPNYTGSQATYNKVYDKGTLRRYCDETNLFYLIEGTANTPSAVWRGINNISMTAVAVEEAAVIEDNSASLANWSLARTRYTNSVYTASSISNGYVGCLNKENKKHIEGDVRTSGRFIESQQDTTENYVWVALEKESDTYGVLMPYAQPNVQGVAYEKYLRPKGIADVHVPSTNPTTGLSQAESTIEEDEELADRFVLINIRLPQRYIRSAERQLSIAIVKYMYDNNFYQYNYSIKFSRIYNAQNPAVAALLNENIALYINEYDNNVVRQYASNYQFIKKANEILPEIVINVVSELSSYESKEKKQYKRLTGIVQANTRAIDSAVTKQIEGLKSGVVKKNLISENTTDVSFDENTSATTGGSGNSGGGSGGSGGSGGGNTNVLDSFDMVFTCPDANTLQFYCRNSAYSYATLVAGNANEDYYIPNGTLTLNEDREYYIYAYAVRSSAYILQSNSIRVYPFRRTNINENAQYAEGEVYVGNNTTQAFVGKVSQINYNSNAKKPYRTVTIWLGYENNPTLEFQGTQIHDVDGKFTLKLGSGNTELKLGDVTTGFHFSSNGLKMKKAKMQSENEEGTIPCYRGDFDLNKVYNEGDEVRVKIDERNYTTVRCLQDGTHGINPLDNSIFWVALAPQSIIDEYSSMVMEKIDETIYQIPTGETRNFKAGTSRVYADGKRLFSGIDYTETSTREITLLTEPATEIEKLVIEAIFE